MQRKNKIKQKTNKKSKNQSITDLLFRRIKTFNEDMLSMQSMQDLFFKQINRDSEKNKENFENLHKMLKDIFQTLSERFDVNIAVMNELIDSGLKLKVFLEEFKDLSLTSIQKLPFASEVSVSPDYIMRNFDLSLKRKENLDE